MTTGCFYIDFYSKKLNALSLAQGEIIKLWNVCSEDFDHHDGDYRINFANEGENRTITVDWEYCLLKQSLSLTFLNPPECQKD